MQPFRMSAVALLDAYRSRALSPLEAMRDVLQRVARFEPHIQATYLLAPERALDEARASEERWRRGEPIGPLDGVPVTIKENIATKGAPVPLGTAASRAVACGRGRAAGGAAARSGRDHPQQDDDARLRHAVVGAVELPSADAQPLGPDARIRAAAAAGAGAGGAAGCGPLHVGTDIGGSVRLPAGWCGIFALKPSGGRVPIDPPYIGRVAGPMTRNVADAALMMALLAQPDARDTMSLPAAGARLARLERDARRPAHRPAARGGMRPAVDAAGARRGRAGGGATSPPPAPSSSRSRRF